MGPLRWGALDKFGLAPGKRAPYCIVSWQKVDRQASFLGADKLMTRPEDHESGLLAYVPSSGDIFEVLLGPFYLCTRII